MTAERIRERSAEQRRRWALVTFAAAVAVAFSAESHAQQGVAASAGACDQLASVALPGTTIRAAETIAAGAFTPPPGPGGATPEPYAELPAFCRVVGEVSRTNDTPVTFEAWMPIEGWTGDFEPASSGFAGGRIGYGGMRSILARGVATANTNRGHDVSPGGWNLVNMGPQPLHLAMDRAKQLITAFYGRSPSFTYMNQCGGGGSRDALHLIQHSPDTLDAAAAVGIVYRSTRHGVAQMWVWQAMHASEASYVPPSQYPLIHRAALDACDAADGLVDGIISDPERCDFDPGVLLCEGPAGPDCLTAPQVEAVRTIYSPPVHGRTGEYLYSPMFPGGELGWEDMAGETPYPYVLPFYRFVVFNDPEWHYNTSRVNFDTHVDMGDQHRIIDSDDPDIREYVERGGVLLLVGGWNDHTLGPAGPRDYYLSIAEELGAETIRDSVRLFMVPGMDHCFGEDYDWAPTYDLDAVAVLRQWKDTGVAPDELVVDVTSDGRTSRQLVCAYPRIARYAGSGSTDDPANFSCVLP